MKFGALVAEALLAGTESTEILSSPRDDVVVEIEVDSTGLIWSTVSMGSTPLNDASG